MLRLALPSDKDRRDGHNMGINGNASKEKHLLHLGEITRLPSVGTTKNLAQPQNSVESQFDSAEVAGGFDGFHDVGYKTDSITAEFTFVTEYDDYLLCKIHTEKVYVAKPPLLRISKYDGLTYNGKDFTRQDVNEMLVEDAVGSEDDETWLVTPDYVAGDIISAIRTQKPIDIAGPKTYWQEIESCRSWAVET